MSADGGYFGARSQSSERVLKRDTLRPLDKSVGPIGPAILEEIMFPWCFVECSIFSNGDSFCVDIYEILQGDHPMPISMKFV